MLGCSSTLRPLLTALVLITACKGSEVPPAEYTATEHAPGAIDAAGPASVVLDPTQRATMERLTGQWHHAGGAAEQEAALAAVDEAIESMNVLIRSMARSRLGATVQIDQTVTFSEQGGVVTISRSERPKPFVGPATGETFDMQTDSGKDARAWLRIEGDSVMTHMHTDDGGGERTYRLHPDGALVIDTRIFSPRLPTDVVYTARYTRP